MIHKLKHKDELLPSNVHIWNVSSLISEKQEQAYFNLLSEDEKYKASRFRFVKDRRTYITARGVLRCLSGAYLKEPPQDIDFDYEAYGKPQFRKPTSLQFNVSHSENYIVIGFVQDHEIGVDIEYMKNNFDVMEVGRNFFSATELHTLESMGQKNQFEGFYRCWTRKEAFIKAKGMGLSFPLDAFSVTLNNDMIAQLIETQWDTLEREKWDMFSFSPRKSCIAAIAVKGKVKSVSINSWQHNLLN
ncbi:4'-phosphopantetheinyl transferase family protein [Spongiimicrobium salis]|uniref:4'-phosphopantetheinyl transferase family protein n=1 Tax=Spongiimicrobium salis TaxID=1667022 RepID=UPI00374D8E58